MGRGAPSIWSAILSIPFIGSGIYLYLARFQTLYLPTGGTINTAAIQLPTEIYIPESSLQIIGISLVVFGGFVFLIGLYVQLASPSPPTLRDDEELVDRRNPTQRVALTKIVLSFPALGVATYLLFFTKVPYIQPTVALVVGLYFFSSGIKTYWVNTLTSYYVTTKRVISDYQFISLRRKEIPLDKIRAVEERKSIMETLVGIGNIRVASGGGGGSVRLKMRNIRDASGFAAELRNLME